MPLTLTCKAIVARLETLYNLFQAELEIYLQVIADSCKKLVSILRQDVYDGII
jgi:hypothetical protein